MLERALSSAFMFLLLLVKEFKLSELFKEMRLDDLGVEEDEDDDEDDDCALKEDGVAGVGVSTSTG